MSKNKEKPTISVLDRLKFTANWLACSSQQLRPDEVVLGGAIYNEGKAMLLGEEGAPVIRLHNIPIKKLKQNDKSFAFVFKEIT